MAAERAHADADDGLARGMLDVTNYPDDRKLQQYTKSSSYNQNVDMSQPCVVLSEGKTSMFFLMFATVSQFNQ
jgi:hypothetical protein